MCHVDLEPCQVFNEDCVIARKYHRCDCCGGDIRPGSAYTSHFSVYDKSITKEKKCRACSMAVEEFAAHHGTYTCPSGMRELIGECLGSYWGGDDDPVAQAEQKLWRLMLLQMDTRYRRRQDRLARAWCPRKPDHLRRVVHA